MFSSDASAGIWNFPGLGTHQLPVAVGELVCVQEEFQGESFIHSVRMLLQLTVCLTVYLSVCLSVCLSQDGTEGTCISFHQERCVHCYCVDATFRLYVVMITYMHTISSHGVSASPC